MLLLFVPKVYGSRFKLYKTKPSAGSSGSPGFNDDTPLTAKKLPPKSTATLDLRAK